MNIFLDLLSVTYFFLPFRCHGYKSGLSDPIFTFICDPNFRPINYKVKSSDSLLPRYNKFCWRLCATSYRNSLAIRAVLIHFHVIKTCNVLLKLNNAAGRVFHSYFSGIDRSRCLFVLIDILKQVSSNSQMLLFSKRQPILLFVLKL